MKVLVPLTEGALSLSIIPAVRRLLEPCIHADARLAGLLATLPGAEVPPQPGPLAEVHLLTVLHPRRAGRDAVALGHEGPIPELPADAEHARLSPADRQHAEEDAATMLTAVAREHFPDVTTACHWLWSETPAERIVEFADELDVDAIAMATHSRSAVVRLLAGSVADGVIRKSSRPVVVQHPLMNHGQVVQPTLGEVHV